MTDIYEEVGLPRKAGRPTPRSDNAFLEFFLQKWREIRDAYKMFPRILTNENAWNWEFGVRFRFLLDEGGDWTAIFVQMDAFRWHSYWGLLDVD